MISCPRRKTINLPLLSVAQLLLRRGLPFLLFAAPLSAEQFVGVSGFAMMNERFPCDRLLHVLEASKRPATAVLWGTFGDDLHCPHAFTEYFRDRPHFLQVHLYNGPAYRNGRPRSGEPFPVGSGSALNGYIEAGFADAAIADRVKNISAYLEAISNGNTTAAISTGLEDDLTDSAFRRVLSIVRRHWAGIVVSNKLGRNPRADVGAELRETHGKAPLRGAYLANEDGDLSPNSKAFIRSHRGAFATILWRARHQGITHGEFVDPQARSFVISNSDIVKLRKLLAEATK